MKKRRKNCVTFKYVINTEFPRFHNQNGAPKMPTMHRCIVSSKPKCIENRIWSHLAALNLKYHRISCTTTIRLNLNSINIKVSFYIKFLSANKSFLVALFAARDFRNCHRRTTSKSSFNSLSAHCSSLTDSVSNIATTEYLVFSTNSIPVFFSH